MTCRYEQLMPVPVDMSMTDAAAVPEVWLTAFQLLYFVGEIYSYLGVTMLSYNGKHSQHMQCFDK